MRCIEKTQIGFRCKNSTHGNSKFCSVHNKKGGESKITNLDLYNKITREAKQKFVWPSAYASGWIVREYKKRGGKYYGPKPSKITGLQRWFSEEWINVCKLPKKVPCGRPQINIRDWKKEYPYCRPLKKISGATPRTAKKLTPAEIEKSCSEKKRNPQKRIKNFNSI